MSWGLSELSTDANLEKWRRLLLTMLGGVYVDAKKTKSIIAIKPQPPFTPIFQVAATKQGSKIRIVNEPLRTGSGSPVVFYLKEYVEKQAAYLKNDSHLLT